MTLLSQELRSVDPELRSVDRDLRDVPLDQLAAPGDSALAHCFALYRQRLEDSALLLGAFNSNI